MPNFGHLYFNVLTDAGPDSLLSNGTMTPSSVTHPCQSYRPLLGLSSIAIPGNQKPSPVLTTPNIDFSEDC